MLQEIWRPIAGYDGKYEVSNFGAVKTLSKMGGRSRLKTPPDRKGYPQVGLYGPGGKTDRKTHRVHNLVAAAFIGPRPEGQQVRHLDGDAGKPWAFNLAYGTAQQNFDDAVRHARQPYDRKGSS